VKLSRMKAWGFVAIAAMAVSIGCAGHPVKFATPEPQQVDRTEGRPIAAKACGFQLLLFFPISINGRAERAYQSLLAQAGSDSIADISVAESWYWGFVGTGYCTEMQATAYPRI